MEQLILGPNITTGEGFQLALSYAKQNTLNITFDKLISSVIAEAEKKINMDPTASLDNLPVLVAQACLAGANIIFLENAIIDAQTENMKKFLRDVIGELGIFFFVIK
ncbi:unnamed protein product [Rotaria sp. Silwood2]|nr:unnamed protein product [Rotaria sp. Silwood2]